MFSFLLYVLDEPLQLSANLARYDSQALSNAKSPRLATRMTHSTTIPPTDHLHVGVCFLYPVDAWGASLRNISFALFHVVADATNHAFGTVRRRMLMLL